jgi:hypothetical protein
MGVNLRIQRGITEVCWKDSGAAPPRRAVFPTPMPGVPLG